MIKTNFNGNDAAATGYLTDDTAFVEQLVQQTLQAVLDAEMKDHLGAVGSRAVRIAVGVATAGHRHLLAAENHDHWISRKRYLTGEIGLTKYHATRLQTMAKAA